MNELQHTITYVQTLRKKMVVLLIVVAIVATALKYFALMGIEGWSLDLIHATINLFLTVAMISIPIYFHKKAESPKLRAVSSRLLGVAVAFTVFMFYILLFIARLFMMREYYAGNSTMLTIEFLFIGLVLFTLVYPVLVHGKPLGART